MTISTREIPLAAWSFLLSQKQEFLNNHLGRVPFTPNQEGTMDIRDEVLSSVDAPDMDTSGCQVSDLNDVEFYWENDQLVFVLRPGLDTPFSPSTFNDEEPDKANSPPPHPTTPVSEGPTQPPVLMRSRPFATRNNVPDFVDRNLFQ